MNMSLIIKLFALLLGLSATAQNLIPNPSFEHFDGDLPSSLYETDLDIASPWFMPLNCFGQSVSSPTFIHENMSVDVLIPIIMLQEPKTGSAMVFNHTSKHNIISDQYIREVFEVKLEERLEIGKNYTLSFYIKSPVDFASYCFIGSDELGVYFSDQEIFTTCISENCPTQEAILEIDTFYNDLGWPYMDIVQYIVESYIDMDTIFYDTENWFKVETSFIADRELEYMFIGSLTPSTQINYGDTTSCGPSNMWSAHLFDDFSLYESEMESYIADAGNDTSICYGEYVEIGTHDYEDYWYWWTPNEDMEVGLADTNPGIIEVSPTESMWYHLTQKDFKFDETSDSIYITVEDIDECLIDDFAGDDLTVCLGDTLVINTLDYPQFDYQWSSSNYLSDLYISNPLFYATDTGVFNLNLFVGNPNTGTTVSDNISITVDACGVALTELERKVQLYPNPARDRVEIKSSMSISSWQIVDAKGNKHGISDENIISQNTISIDVSNLNTGVYFVEIEIEGQKITKQLLIN